MTRTRRGRTWPTMLATSCGIAFLLLLGLGAGGSLLAGGVDAYRATHGGVAGEFEALRLETGGKGDRWWVGTFSSGAGGLQLKDLKLSGYEPDRHEEPPVVLEAVVSRDPTTHTAYRPDSRVWVKNFVGGGLLIVLAPAGAVVLARTLRRWRRTQVMAAAR